MEKIFSNLNREAFILSKEEHGNEIELVELEKLVKELKKDFSTKIKISIFHFYNPISHLMGFGVCTKTDNAPEGYERRNLFF